MQHGHITAGTVSVESDEGRFTLEVVSAEDDPITIDIHSIDLDAFYDQVKGRIGPYLQEKHAAHQLYSSLERMATSRGLNYDQPFRCSPEDVDESGGYAADDPKHPRYHSTHANLWDLRAGK